MAKHFAKISIKLLDDQGISCQAKCVYAILSRYADFGNPDKSVFPSNLTLSEKCNISQTAVKNAIKELVKAGYIRREARYKQSSLTYILM